MALTGQPDRNNPTNPRPSGRQIVAHRANGGQTGQKNHSKVPIGTTDLRSPRKWVVQTHSWLIFPMLTTEFHPRNMLPCRSVLVCPSYTAKTPLRRVKAGRRVRCAPRLVMQTRLLGLNLVFRALTSALRAVGALVWKTRC